MASYGLVSGGRSLRANDWRKASFGRGRGGNGSYKNTRKFESCIHFRLHFDCRAWLCANTRHLGDQCSGRCCPQGCYSAGANYITPNYRRHVCGFEKVIDVEILSIYWTSPVRDRDLWGRIRRIMVAWLMGLETSRFPGRAGSLTWRIDGRLDRESGSLWMEGCSAGPEVEDGIGPGT